MEKKEKGKTIRHPQGNPLELLFPLGKMTVTVADGNETRVGGPMDVDTSYPVKVELTAGVRRHVYDATIVNGFAVINDNGSLPVGVYRVEMVFRDSQHRPMRWAKRTIVEIMETTEDGGTYETDEFGVVARYPMLSGHSAGIVLTEDEVQIHEGIGFHGEVTEGEVQLYAEPGDSIVEAAGNEVRIIINE